MVDCSAVSLQNVLIIFVLVCHGTAYAAEDWDDVCFIQTSMTHQTPDVPCATALQETTDLIKKQETTLRLLEKQKGNLKSNLGAYRNQEEQPHPLINMQDLQQQLTNKSMENIRLKKKWRLIRDKNKAVNQTMHEAIKDFTINSLGLLRDSAYRADAKLQGLLHEIENLKQNHSAPKMIDSQKPQSAQAPAHDPARAPVQEQRMKGPWKWMQRGKQSTGPRH